MPMERKKLKKAKEVSNYIIISSSSTWLLIINVANCVFAVENVAICIYCYRNYKYHKCRDKETKWVVWRSA